MILQNVDKARIRLNTKKDNVAGTAHRTMLDLCAELNVTSLCYI